MRARRRYAHCCSASYTRSVARGADEVDTSRRIRRRFVESDRVAKISLIV